jgi:MscS family membrane protein
LPSETKLIAQLSFGRMLTALVIILVTWIFLKWIRGLFLRLETQNPRTRFLANQLEPPLRIFLWFVALVFAIEVVAPSKDAFLAALGSAALAIGLGLQDLIKNLIGGLVIVADSPFQKGDYVKIGNASGEVVHIGLRSTKLRASDGILVAVPNSDILTQQTFNASGGVPESIVKTHINIPRGADPEAVLRVGREVAVCCPYTHIGRPVSVGFEDRTTVHSFMDLTIAAYVYDHRYASAMQTDILRRAHQQLVSRGLLTFPQRLSDQPN